MLLNTLFYVFSIILLLCVCFVVTVQNSIYSVLFLILSFICATSLLFLMECEFIALLFIIIYVGAITVLFLFVVMMLDIKTISLAKNNIKYFPFGVFIALIFFTEIFLITFTNFEKNPYYNSWISWNIYKSWYNKLDFLIEIEVIGQIIYTHYVLQFLIAGLILFLVVVGVIILTTDFMYQKLKNQIDSKQLSRKTQNTLIF